MPGDTIGVKYHISQMPHERNNLEFLEEIPKSVKNIIRDNHAFIEDTLIVSLKGDHADERASIVREALNAFKDTTTIMVRYYAKEIESSDNILIHYVYSTKLYTVEDGYSGCFQTNWSGYILEDGDVTEVYPDLVTTTIPMMYGCLGDHYKTHSIYRPSRMFLENGRVIIKGSASGWDCRYGVTLVMNDDGIALVSEYDWERCYH